jgi:hypothetical protein
MKSTTGFFVFGSSSVEFASLNLQTCLANATIASWNPKQIPRYGMSFALAKLAAFMIPSLPLIPKPPGASIPSKFFNIDRSC